MITCVVVHTISHKMILIITILCLYASKQTACGQPQYDTFKLKPEKCYGTYELTDRRCCIFPPFFNRASARECGALTSVKDINNNFNVTSLRREIKHICKYWKCILNKYQLLDNGQNLVQDKYFTHLDDWAALNNEFSHVLTTAKTFCRSVYKLLEPVNACKFYDYQSCIRNYMTVDCPKIIQSKECFEWKEFYEECKEFYI